MYFNVLQIESEETILSVQTCGCVHVLECTGMLFASQHVAENGRLPSTRCVLAGSLDSKRHRPQRYFTPK